MNIIVWRDDKISHKNALNSAMEIISLGHKSNINLINIPIRSILIKESLIKKSLKT